MHLFRIYPSKTSKGYGRYIKLNRKFQLFTYDPTFSPYLIIYGSVSGICPEYHPRDPYEIN